MPGGYIDSARKVHDISGQEQKCVRRGEAIERVAVNLAILLEDLNREEEAIAIHREALAHDPSLYDAHFNLSRLHERVSQPQVALRHLLAYGDTSFDTATNKVLSARSCE